MLTLTRASLVCALLAVAVPCPGQDAAHIDNVIQPFVSAHQFMGSVLVARGRDVVFSKGYRSANLEWDIPNTPTTKFRLGSLTKQFTAASILILEEHGKLNVTDSVTKYVPDAPAAWSPITIFHLLTHTSGIPSFTSFPEYGSWKPFPTSAATLVGRFRDKPPEFQPGENWNYSNSGYLLLGYLIEKISGSTYDAFVRDNIFMPLGMTDSGYDSNQAVIARRASGYSPSLGGATVNAGFIDMSIPHAAGALYSTTEDLLRWEQGLFGGNVIPAASLRKMITPFKNDYAFGVRVRTVDGRRVVQHSGGIEGFNTALAHYPESQVTVIVLGNLNGRAPDQIAEGLGAPMHAPRSN